MDRLDDHILAGDFPIHLTGERNQIAVRINSPGGGVIPLFIGKTKQFPNQARSPQNFFRTVIDAAAFHCLQSNFSWANRQKPQVLGAFDQRGHERTHGIYSVRQCDQKSQKALRYLNAQALLNGMRLLNGNVI